MFARRQAYAAAPAVVQRPVGPTEGPSGPRTATGTAVPAARTAATGLLPVATRPAS
jgi:hypothetical protein